MDASPLKCKSTPGTRYGHARDFWLLWLVGLVVYAVRFTEGIAIAIFVYQQTGSPFLVAAMALLRLLPMGLFGILLGAITERLERRFGLILSICTMLLTDLCLAGLARFGNLEVWHLGLASFVGGIVWAADLPVRRMMIGEIIGNDRLGRAIAIDTGANNACRVVGPIVGGLIFSLAGIFGIFAFSAFLYAVALCAAFAVNYRSVPIRHALRETSTRLLTGLKFGWTNSKLRKILGLSLVSSVFGWPCASMIPVIGRDHLHLGAKGIGLLAGMEGVGAIAAVTLIALYATPRRYGPIFAGGTVLYQIAPIAYALVGDPILSGIMVFVSGFGNAGFLTMQVTLVCDLTPIEMRGRMLGVMAAANGIAVVGFFFIGFVADILGARGAVVLTAIIGLVGLLLTIRYWRHL
jgi:MFS family permease